jgi:hypothetical protein
MSHKLCRQPPGLLYLSTRGPWPWSERGREVDRPNPATAIAGGEGGGAGKHHQVLAHLQTVGIGSGWPVAAARQEQCGRRWRRMAAAVLRWS